MDVLRTFVTGFELRSFSQAAERLGRSPSAVSTQLRKLEDQIGQPLVQKSGRKLALTTAGESLLSYAKQILDLNDQAVETIRGSDVEGWVRLGLPQDFAETWLPAVLNRFSRAHPKVRIEVQVDRSVPLIDKTGSGELDLALVWGDGSEARHAEHVADVPIHWIGRPDWPGVSRLEGDPVPIAAFVPPCRFRSAAITALDDRNVPWRLVFTSPSLAGLWAAAEGGLAITARTALSMPRALTVLDPASHGLPALPQAPLALHHTDANLRAAVARMRELLLEALKTEIDRGIVGRSSDRSQRGRRSHVDAL